MGALLVSLPTTTALRLLLVDDHPVVLDGLTLLLRADPAITIVGSVGSARAAVAAARETHPDVVLLDLRLPDALGVEAIGALRAAAPGVKIVVFTAHAEHAGIHAAIEAGVDGCLLKDAVGTDLARAIRRVANGERVFDARIAETTTPQLRSRLNKVGLSRREYEVLRLMAVGKTNPEIATTLGLARNTVKTYLQSAMQKLGARNRVEAISRAHEVALL